MPTSDRIHMRGQFLTIDGGKATIGRDPASVRKGQFMTVDAKQPPRQHFITQGDAIKLLAVRLQAVRQQIENITKVKR